MFEKFTEDARKTVFFARYEASNFGADEIDTEHLLLGILRADKNLARRLFPSYPAEQAVRRRIERERRAGERVSTSIDMPLSATSKRALSLASEEATRLGQEQITPEHLLLGIAHEEPCLAAIVLRDAGHTFLQLRLEAAVTASESGAQPRPEPIRRSSSGPFRDPAETAETAEPTPLIGREAELTRAVQILTRRTKNNVALVGEPGVGKTAVVEGLAGRLSSGALDDFSGCRVLVADARALFPNRGPEQGTSDLFNIFAAEGNVLLCIEGLFDLVTARTDWGTIAAMHILEPHLSRGAFRCVATGTPAGFSRTAGIAPVVVRHFEAIGVAAPDPAGAVEILRGLKPVYERFHGVVFGEGTIEMAVYASGRFLAHRSLPDRALDLMDEAGARARLRKPANKTVTPGDVEQVVADRAGVRVSAVTSVLAQKGEGALEKTIRELAGAITIDGNGWVALLAEHIVRSSHEEIDTLTDAIRRAKTNE